MTNITKNKSYRREITILQVSDNIENINCIQHTLQNIATCQFNLFYTHSLEDAIGLSTDKHFDVILLDTDPGNEKTKFALEQLKSHIPDIPIIMLAYSQDEAAAINAISLGAQDYLFRDRIEKDLVNRTIQYAIDRKKSEIELRFLVKHDSLTGLVNRQSFQEQLHDTVLRCESSEKSTALFFIDIDRFKKINDEYSHSIGDAVLKETAKRINSCIRPEDVASRLGSDQFTIIIENFLDSTTLSEVAEKLLNSISDPIEIKNHEIHLTASIGIAIFENNKRCSANALFKHSDIAMHRAKRQGLNSFKYYTPEMSTAIKARNKLETQLRQALNKNEFSLLYQPQIDTKYEKMIGAEALLRWDSPDKGTIQPSSFIPLLEQTGLIIPVSEWVLKTASRQWNNWINNNTLPSDCTLSINLSPLQFRQPNLIDSISNILEETGLPASGLDLEITENILLEQNQTNINTLNNLKKLGVSLSIDDFGTGYSSLNYLKHFAIDRLKVDRTFTKDILNNQTDIAIASSIINLAKNLKLEVIVEGVDDINKIELLKKHGGHIFQGFYFSNPLTPEQFSNQYSSTTANTCQMH